MRESVLRIQRIGQETTSQRPLISPLESVRIFHGEVTPALVHWYVRLDHNTPNSGTTLTGTVTGPFRSDARTLTTTSRLVPSAPGESILAEAVVPDPCGWTSDTPALYQFDLELWDHQQIVERQRIVSGIRGLGCRDKHLFRHGKRWVVRGVETSVTESPAWDTWKSTGSAIIVESPDEGFCAAASDSGVPLILKLPHSGPDLDKSLPRLVNWPAISMVILKGQTDTMVNLQRHFPNTLFGQLVSACQPMQTGQPAAWPSWAELAVCEVDTPDNFRAIASTLKPDHPIVAFRKVTDTADFRQARSKCDHLQRELAPHGDYAGYLVLKTE